MGLTETQVISDVLDRFEAHLGFLHYSSERASASTLTPPSPAVPAVADDVERIED